MIPSRWTHKSSRPGHESFATRNRILVAAVRGTRLKCGMSRVQFSTPVCPKCHRTMKLMLVKGEPRRALRCIDCDLPDPLQNPETQGWLNGELNAGK